MPIDKEVEIKICGKILRKIIEELEEESLRSTQYVFEILYKSLIFTIAAGLEKSAIEDFVKDLCKNIVKDVKDARDKYQLD